MAHTKAGGTSKWGRDSESKRLGVKITDGQIAIPGNIIIRQRGTKFYPGTGTRLGKDDTIYAVSKGTVRFQTKRKTNFNRSTRVIKVISIV